MFLKFLVMFYICVYNLFSYDKVEVISYKEDENFSKAKSMYVYNDKLYILIPPKIFVYTSTLSFINSIEAKTDLAISFAVHNDRFYVLDGKNCEVKVYDSSGKIIFRFGGCGSEVESLNSPQYIKIFDNKVFIANKLKVNVYSEDGLFLYSFNTHSKDKAKLYNPDLITFDPEGFLIVFDKKNQLIAKYDYLGDIKGEYFKRGFPGDITSEGFVYTGSEDGKIREYDLDFNQKGMFGTKGKNRYEFQSFTDIKAYKNGVFVLDAKNKKIVYLRVENMNKRKINRIISFRDDILLKPFKVSLFDGHVFNVAEDKIFFYSNKKGSKGIYGYDGLNFKPFLVSKDILSVIDMFFLDGKFYLLDNLDYKVKVFNEKGYLFGFGEKISFLSDKKEAKFSQPVRMSFDSKGNIYVLDSKLNYINVFNKDGLFLYSIDVGKSLDDKLLDLFVRENNELIVLSRKNVYFLGQDGRIFKKFDLKYVKEAVSFCSDFKDYIFILDKHGRIVVYDFKGNYLASFGSRGVGEFDFSQPYLIRYNNNRLFVSETTGRFLSFDVQYFSYPLNFNVYCDTSSYRVIFGYEIKNERYVKELYVEKSTDNVNFTKVTTSFDDNLVNSTTHYYRLKLITHSGNEIYSETKEVFINLDEKKSPKLQTSAKPPIEIVPVNLDYIFAANYKYYFSNPLGKVIIRNNIHTDFENLKLSFFIKEYMDFSYDIVVDSLPANSQKEILINAVLNNKILTVSETTPVQARLTLQYYFDTQEKEVSLNIPVKILSRNSIVWDDPRRLANFITVKDPIISDLAKMIAMKKNEIKSDIDDNIKVFSLFYRYFSDLGVRYIEDPVTPYNLSRSSYSIIDTVQYPRNLIRIKAGDCDDLTALFASLLEAAGIETVLMDYNDHITLMFELKNPSNPLVAEDMVIEYDSKYYLPIEVTLLGKDVYSSLDYAVKEYKLKKEKVKFYPVREMISIYEPPTFTQDSEVQITLPSDLVEEATKDIELIENRYYDYYENYYRTILSEEPQDNDAKLKLATIYAIRSKYEEAKKIFESVLEENPTDPVALNNLANIYHIKSDFEKASKLYEMAHQADPYDADILVNYAKNFAKMNKKDEAKIILEKAIRINPEIKKIERDILEGK